MRYYIFRLWFRQWFKDHDGIKAFAQQAMNWVLQSALSLAARLKKKNRQFSENIKEHNANLLRRRPFPVLDADEFSSVRAKIRGYSFGILICVLAEVFFNYFAAHAILTLDGLLGEFGRVVLAMVFTVTCILVFEHLVKEVLHQNPYKGEVKEPRNWLKMVLLVLVALFFEALNFYAAKIRGAQIEGVGASGPITMLMTILGLVVPIAAGYFAYDKSRYINVYKNTLAIARAEAAIADLECRIAANDETMQTHLKQQWERRWAIVQEFRTYKENYNRKHGIAVEQLQGHFCETQTTFIQEAITRYRRETLPQMTPALGLTQVHSGNGQSNDPTLVIQH